MLNDRGGSVERRSPPRARFPTTAVAPFVQLFAGSSAGVEDAMGWIAVGVALTIAFGIVIKIARRPPRDLGAVSTNWLEQHRDAP